MGCVAVRVELPYLDGYPNWRLTEERLTTALRLANRPEVPVVRISVETPDQAVELGFVGSPTVLIDGRDPLATGGSVRVWRAGFSQVPRL